MIKIDKEIPTERDVNIYRDVQIRCKIESKLICSCDHHQADMTTNEASPLRDVEIRPD